MLKSLDEFNIHFHNDYKEALNKPIEFYNSLYGNESFNSNVNLYKYIDFKFDNTYEIIAISDIHADFMRFKDFLIKMKLIIYDYRKTKYNWNPLAHNKVIVICGDLIDGKRNGHNNSILTNNNELNLHIFIYNLRLKAAKYNSYIFCTLGNHDYFAFHVLHRDTPNYLYNQYIDDNSKEGFIKLYKQDLFTNINLLIEKSVSKDKERYIKLYNFIVSKFKNIHINELTYISRNYILSRFYILGYHFFLKINDSLFAHAGFYKEKNVFELFEAKDKNVDSSASPELVHRNILRSLCNINDHINFYSECLEGIFNITYFDLYNHTILKVEKLLDDKFRLLYSTLLNINEESLVNRFFLTREFQKNCAIVDEVLNMYGCNLLVIGHCPSCIFDIFDASNIEGITNCNNAKIVFSCSSKLATVDIAFSSAFSPTKRFYEYLSIKINSENKKKIKVIRYNISDKTLIEYHNKTFDEYNRTWI